MRINFSAAVIVSAVGGFVLASRRITEVYKPENLLHAVSTLFWILLTVCISVLTFSSNGLTDQVVAYTPYAIYGTIGSLYLTSEMQISMIFGFFRNPFHSYSSAHTLGGLQRLARVFHSVLYMLLPLSCELYITSRFIAEKHIRTSNLGYLDWMLITRGLRWIWQSPNIAGLECAIIAIIHQCGGTGWGLFDELSVTYQLLVVHFLRDRTQQIFGKTQLFLVSYFSFLVCDKFLPSHFRMG